MTLFAVGRSLSHDHTRLQQLTAAVTRMIALDLGLPAGLICGE